MTTNAQNGLAIAKKCWQNHLQKNALRILVLNLMPTKLTTELQFLNNFNRYSNDVNLTFLYPETHHFKGISSEVIHDNYVNFDQINNRYFDGLIITGAPIEKLSFSEIDYWQEFNQILTWAQSHVKEILLECWAAQAGLYANFGIKKQVLNKKIFGIFAADKVDYSSKLTRNFKVNNLIRMPQSRHSQSLISPENLPSGLKIVASSHEAGPMILRSRKCTYITGHPEYDKDTLAQEYFRDKEKGYSINIPQHYFDNKENTRINFSWKSSTNLIFQNWLSLIAE